MWNEISAAFVFAVGLHGMWTIRYIKHLHQPVNPWQYALVVLMFVLTATNLVVALA